jgi:hypothetical protein
LADKDSVFFLEIKGLCEIDTSKDKYANFKISCGHYTK